jgi:hypothetical protein
MKDYIESKIISLLNSLKLNSLHDLQEEVRHIVQ